MNYAKQIKQERKWYEEGLKIAKNKRFSSTSCDKFAMWYERMKKICEEKKHESKGS